MTDHSPQDEDEVTEPREPLTASAGVLAAGGAARVMARVYTAPTPQIVPADLADVLDPVPDAHGQLLDWALNPAALLRQHPDRAGATRAAYQHWRASYVTEASLGDLATVRAFVRFAADQQVAHLDALRALATDGVRIDPATATGLAAGVDAVAAAARASDAEGLGLAAPNRPGLLRAFLVSHTPLVVLAGGTAQVSASRAGLELTWASAPPTGELGLAPAAGRRLLLLGWDLDAAGVSALTADGDRVALGDGDAARLLTQLAPGRASVRVHPVPPTSVFADLIVHLPGLARRAARAATALVVGTAG